jgi:hypothetical protein
MRLSKRPNNNELLLLASIFVFGTCASLQAQPINSISHGTCAIAVQNGKNVAFIIDSSVIVTRTGPFGPLATQKILECKVWSQMPNMLVSTTGMSEFTSPKWASQESGRRWFSNLSPKSTPADIDSAMRGWGQELIDTFASNPAILRPQDGEITSLFVIFRSDEKSHFYKERIVQSQGKIVRDDLESVRWDLPETVYAHLTSGSCRNFVRVDGWPPTIRPTDAEKIILEKLATDLLARNKTVAELDKSLLLYEQNFATLNNNHALSSDDIDQIGPPYQTANFSDEKGAWQTNFTSPCENTAIPPDINSKPTASHAHP